jgi:hypothetical protein
MRPLLFVVGVATAVCAFEAMRAVSRARADRACVARRGGRSRSRPRRRPTRNVESGTGLLSGGPAPAAGRSSSARRTAPPAPPTPPPYPTPPPPPQTGLVPAGVPGLPQISMHLFSLTSFCLSLLLVFRTNASYERWDGARKMWGLLLNRSRDLVRQASAARRAPPRARPARPAGRPAAARPLRACGFAAARLSCRAPPPQSNPPKPLRPKPQNPRA